MTEIINARFRAGGKAYSFNPNGLTIQPGQGLILPSPMGPQYGVCTEGNHMVDETTLVAPLRQVIRLATPEDEQQVKSTKEQEREAFKLAREKIAQRGLEMSLVAAQFAPEGRIVFYFTAENRVDFRALVKDLANTLHARIEMRQIGVRDETKLLGGIGICGQPYCCARYLNRFQPVSIKMAKTQGLALNPVKISGACGRLMCCLKYEQEAYEDAQRRMPRRESFVETPDGAGTATELDYLRERVKVQLEGSTEQPKRYRLQEIRVVRSGKGARPQDYVAPPKEELEALRYIPPEEERRAAEPKSDLTMALEEIFAGEAKRAPTRKPSRSGSGRGSRRGSGEGKNAAPERKSGGEQPHKPSGQQRAKSRNNHQRRKKHEPSEPS